MHHLLSLVVFHVDQIDLLTSGCDFQDAQDLKCLHLITDEIFEDEAVTWGKIVVLFAFAASLALSVSNTDTSLALSCFYSLFSLFLFSTENARSEAPSTLLM